MHYEFKPTFGMELYLDFWKPFKKVVNNGCVIETQDDGLIELLIDDEINRNSKPIDWWLFKAGEVVLYDGRGNRFACTISSGGHYFKLVKIMKG